jgi:hypothetical protein
MSSKAVITIQECTLNDTSTRAPGSAFASQILFDIVVDGEEYHCWTTLTCRDEDDLDVGPAQGYPKDRPWDQSAFATAVEHYYRMLIRQQGVTSDKALTDLTDMAMSVALRQPYSFEIEMENPPPSLQ